jgi:hypothetical protein
MAGKDECWLELLVLDANFGLFGPCGLGWSGLEEPNVSKVKLI